MYKTFNYIISTLIPIIPKSIIKIFARRYIAGITINDAMNTVKKINQLKLSATLDILGEHTKNKHEAIEITEEYTELYNKISKNNLDCNISLKPTHIGSDINNNLFNSNLSTILRSAIKNNNFLRIDILKK